MSGAGVALSSASTPLPELSPDQAASTFADALEESADTDAASWRRATGSEDACTAGAGEDAASPRPDISDGSQKAVSRASSSPLLKHTIGQEAAALSLSEQEGMPADLHEDVTGGMDNSHVSVSDSDGSPVVAQSVLRTRRIGRIMVDDEDESPARPSSSTGCASGSQRDVPLHCKSSLQDSPALAQRLLGSVRECHEALEAEKSPAASHHRGSVAQPVSLFKPLVSAVAKEGAILKEAEARSASQEAVDSPDSPHVAQSTVRKGHRSRFLVDDSDSDQDPSATASTPATFLSASGSDADASDEDASDLEDNVDFGVGCTPEGCEEGGPAAEESPFWFIQLSSDSDGEGEQCLVATGVTSKRRSRIEALDSNDDDIVGKENTPPVTPQVPTTSARSQRPLEAAPSRAPKTAPPGGRRPPLLASKTPMTAAAFKRQRESLTADLFREYNDRVFGGRLPADMAITWNVNLRTTAGLTYSKRALTEDEMGFRYTSRVELSSKVVDTLDKLKRTLMHELCHAAAWMINHVTKPPHGAHFKYWAGQAMRIFPEMDVTTCHSYTIHYPFQWQCTNSWCCRIVKRHSHSVDVERQVCGSCQGRLQFLGRFNADGTPAAKRGPSKFSLFVRDNFSAVKRDFPAGTPHADVMRQLAERWRKQKAAGQGAAGADAAVRRLDLSGSV